MPDYTPVPYQLLGGVNSADAETELEPQEVVDAQNFLFERQRSVLRPGLGTAQALAISGNGVFGKSTRLNRGGSIVTLIVSSNGHLFRLNPDYTVVDLGAITFGTTDLHNAQPVNSVLMVGNVPSGIVRVDPSTNTTTQPASASFRYVYSFQSRAIGAWNYGDATYGPITVGWTKPGDETTWTGATNGSGTAILSDAPDEITGIGTIRNVWVVLRRGGIHLGFQTGVAIPAFRFEQFQRDGAGCGFPSTAAFEDNVAYFCGNEDVYSFDLQNITPIGGKIRYELMQYLDAGVVYRGFISRSVSSTQAYRFPRLRYHLFPAGLSTYPHFVYDEKEQKWSRHSYTPQFVTNGAFYYIQTTTFESPSVFDNKGNLFYWDSSLPCESPGYLVGRVFRQEPYEHDYRVNRVLLNCRNVGEATPTVSVFSALNNTRTSKFDTQTVGTTEAEGLWMRNWFNIDAVGNDFQLRIDTPPNQFFETNYASMMISDAGEYKGPPSIGNPPVASYSDADR